MAPEAILVARDVVKSLFHSASLTRSIVENSFPQPELARRLSASGIRLPHNVGDRVIDAASLLLPTPLRSSHTAIAWDDLVAAAVEPGHSKAWRFSLAAHAALKRACGDSPARVLISEWRLFAAYAATAPREKEEVDRLAFLSALIVRLYETEVIVDIRRGPHGRAGDYDGVLCRAVFALGLFMAASIESRDADRAGQFRAAVDLAAALGDEIGPPTMADPKLVRHIVDRYKDHL